MPIPLSDTHYTVVGSARFVPSARPTDLSSVISVSLRGTLGISMVTHTGQHNVLPCLEIPLSVSG